MRTTILYIFCITLSQIGFAQSDSTDNAQKTLAFPDFLHSVSHHNLDYAAEKFNVKMAEAEIIQAGMFPDPEISFDYANNSDKSMDLGQVFTGELGWTLELGGKRKARIGVAESEKIISELALADYFQNLRAEAGMLYIEAMEKKAMWDLQEKNYESMLQLSQADSIRHSLGEISEIDAIQSRLEVNIIRNDVWDAETDWKNAFQKLFIMMGPSSETDFTSISKDFFSFNKDYGLNYLLEKAYKNRADLALAEEDIQLADRFIALAKANRKIDIDLSVGIETNTEATNHIAETPAFTSYQAGIAIPLKFSNKRSSEKKIAEYESEVKKLNLLSLKREVENEIAEAFNDYQNQIKKTNAYQNDLNLHAKKVLDGKVYSYQRGEISLLEVINAQRTYNEVMEEYYNTLAETAKAFIELQRVSGIWEID